MNYVQFCLYFKFTLNFIVQLHLFWYIFQIGFHFFYFFCSLFSVIYKIDGTHTKLKPTTMIRFTITIKCGSNLI